MMKQTNFTRITKVVAACVLTVFSALSIHGFVVVGHRGAAGYEPENTLRSFARAIAIGVDMIELDVHCCASGELVVIHDYWINRTTNGRGFVKNHTLEELKKLDAGLGEQVPTLAEVFNLVNRKVIINIELKGKGTAAPTAQLIHEYVTTRGWSADDFLVSSFDANELAVFSQQAPQVSRGLLCRSFLLLPWKTCDDLKISMMGVPACRATQTVIDEAHKRGMKLYIFTVNNKKDAQQFKAMNADGIFSDYPDIFKK
jgi:glycerophosphoryl diester phosphodiesterase